MDLSIIIVSHNTQELLKDCLNSISKAQTPARGLEIFVVDNASNDGSQEMLKKDFPKVNLIINKDNLGFARANNQATKQATGRYLLFLNSDTKLSRNSLVKPVKYLKRHPEVGGLTVKLVLPSGKLDPDNHRGFPTPWTALTHFSRLNQIFPKSHLFNNYFQSYKNFNTTHKIDVTAGSYLMMPAKLFHSLGGWDENFFFYGEDIDLSYRINQSGKKIIYYPKVEVIHYKGASSGLRKESRNLAHPSKTTRIKAAQASASAMKIFYKKFYYQKYPKIITTPILLGITLLGKARVLKHRLS